jgi:hypothetical protein
MNSNKKSHNREDAIAASSQEPETALPFPQDGSGGPTAPQAQSSESAAPKADGDGSHAPPDPSEAVTKPEGPAPLDLDAVIEAKRAARDEDAAEAFDPFDPARLRCSQDFAAAVGVRKKLVYVRVDKPSNEWFIRTHPDETYRLTTGLLTLKQEREDYLVDPALWSELAGEPAFSFKLLVLGVSRQAIPFLWPLRLPGPDGRLDPWGQSALEACELARTEWVRVKSNVQVGAYDISVATFRAEPEWPVLKFQEILRIAFRDKVILSWDHPVLRRLRGEI